MICYDDTGAKSTNQDVMFPGMNGFEIAADTRMGLAAQLLKQEEFFMRSKKIGALFLSFAMVAGLCACSQNNAQTDNTKSGSTSAEGTTGDNDAKAYIEDILDLANNEEQEWTYSEDADAWVLGVVSAVAYPELPDYQGVSVCVPGAYVAGIDTDGDGAADETSGTAGGSLVVDDEAQIVSSNGQVYTAATAPVILNTGAAGYSEMSSATASTSHASDGYINVSCGNRGKQSTATNEDGDTYYTGDAPSCLADQKAAARFVKYNILLGNLPGNVDAFVATGGSGGGAHAVMFAATGNNPDFYDYQIEAGAVGVYKEEDGAYSTTVTIDGEDYEISDGAWGCIAYSAITPLYEADMSLAFEYDLDTDYSFGSSFQAQLAEYLSESYMEYINGQDLSVEESAAGFDLDGDGEQNSTVALTIGYDTEAHPETNGYYGSYLDLYLAEFTQDLQWYLDNLDYTEDWTWFNEDGSAMSDENVAAMSTEDKAEKFVAGLYTATASGGMGELPDGEQPGMDGARGRTAGKLPDGEQPDGTDGGPGKAMRGHPEGALPGDMGGDAQSDDNASGMGGIAGTPDTGTTQSASGSSDSANYSTYEEMVEAYQTDIEDVYAGDEYGNNIVELYNPLNYIGADATDDPTWAKILMGASEGDMSMFNSLNLQIAWLDSGVDAEIEWQWNGGHVPNEILGDSFSLYLDQMYGTYAESAASITKPKAAKQTENGAAEEATGADLSGWVSYVDGTVSFSLADAAAYRTDGASKAMPGFDVIDYGQEDYVFGDEGQDARHWDKYLLEIFRQHADTLEPLFNQKSYTQQQ